MVFCWFVCCKNFPISYSEIEIGHVSHISMYRIYSGRLLSIYYTAYEITMEYRCSYDWLCMYAGYTLRKFFFQKVRRPSLINGVALCLLGFTFIMLNGNVAVLPNQLANPILFWGGTTYKCRPNHM